MKKKIQMQLPYDLVSPLLESLSTGKQITQIPRNGSIIHNIQDIREKPIFINGCATEENVCTHDSVQSLKRGVYIVIRDNMGGIGDTILSQISQTQKDKYYTVSWLLLSL